MDGLKLDEVYHLRDNFIVLGLTGKNSAGCSTIANLLTQNTYSEFLDEGGNRRIVEPRIDNYKHNSERKYKIVYNYLKENWKPFKLISYNQILIYLIMDEPFDNLISFLTGLKESLDFSDEIMELNKLKVTYQDIQIRRKTRNQKILDKFSFLQKGKFDISKNIDYLQLYLTYFNSDFHNFTLRLHRILSAKSKYKRIKLLELIAENIRKSGKPFDSVQRDKIHVYNIVQLINKLIIAWKFLGDKNNDARIVIDSLRNSLEIMFLKERHSGFYSLSVNMDEERRTMHIRNKYKHEAESILKMDEMEYKGELGKLYKQDVRNCIQNSDIHLHNIKEITKKIEEKDYRLNLKQQIIQYISLILQPGIITPSPEERCMQFAHVAKSNSGCISRQVGAVITDSSYSIKAVGWNNTPEYQVPCLLRNIEDLKNGKDLEAFSNYEKKNTEFKKKVNHYYGSTEVNNSRVNLCGRNLSFCFKTVQNSISEGKNQIHTRSLHAEENAFLQITKYGGSGIKNGLLFTSASPCELCSKKAYQLGIKKIYYIDPYPGIAEEQILKGGINNPELILFNGAVGRAYHKLYEPFMPYKDELNILLNLKIKNKLDEVKEDYENLKKEKEFQSE